jgi:uncharacterized protein (DUF433 family)
MSSHQSLVDLGQGVYTVPETCRILRPSMTPRKVHYWLDTGLLGEPLRRGSRGTPTLLRFEQVLKVRTLQHLRDELRFSLQAVRQSLEVLLRDLVADNWYELRFFIAPWGHVGVVTSQGPIDLPGAQALLDVPPALTNFVREMRTQWERRTLRIQGFDHLVSNAQVLAGSPTIAGTRIETAFIANLTEELSLAEIGDLFPYAPDGAIFQAAKFEGVSLAA